MRPKEFNREHVLDKCIILFWKQGYGGTGIEKVVSNTGVNRFSLYEEFKNKRGVLFASLKLYIERYVPLNLLVNSSTIKESLFQFHHHFFQSFSTNNHPLGCYIISIAMELREDKEIQQFLNAYLEVLQRNFSNLLAQLPLLSEGDSETISKQLSYFYCSSMSMCVILSPKEIERHLHDNLNLITKCLEE